MKDENMKMTMCVLMVVMKKLLLLVMSIQIQWILLLLVMAKWLVLSDQWRQYWMTNG